MPNVEDLEPERGNVSLFIRTIQFLCSRQRGRATAQDKQPLCDQWQLNEPSSQLSGQLDGYEAHTVTFDEQAVERMRLIQIPKQEADRHKDQPAMCVYGCGKWFNNQVYVISVVMFLTLE